MIPHPYKDLIIAWANGAEVETYHETLKRWVRCPFPGWYQNEQYRIKPVEEKGYLIAGPAKWSEQVISCSAVYKHRSTTERMLQRVSPEYKLYEVSILNGEIQSIRKV